MGMFWVSLTACASKPSRTEATPTPIPAPVIPAKPTVKVQRGDVIKTIEFSGRIVPVARQGLSFRTAGRVRQVYVTKDDAVTKGQLLAELETGRSGFDIRRARVNLEIAQLNLEQAKLQTPRSSAQYTVTIAIKEREVELAQIAVDELESTFTDVRVTSPITGTVLAVSIAEGNMVEAFKPVIVVANLNDLEISADLKGEDLPLVSVGMKVMVRPVGNSNQEVEGEIRSVPNPSGSGASSAPADDTVRVSLNKQPAELGYKLGDLFQMTILLAERDGVLWLPPQAMRDFEGRKFVIVQDSGGQRRLDIKVGLQGNDRVEIVEGVTEGQVIVAP
jgi:RND family efflux transporter MFP subunit